MTMMATTTIDRSAARESYCSFVNWYHSGMRQQPPDIGLVCSTVGEMMMIVINQLMIELVRDKQRAAGMINVCRLISSL